MSAKPNIFRHLNSDINRMLVTIVSVSSIISTVIILTTVHFYYFHFLEPGNDYTNLFLSLLVTVSYLLLSSLILTFINKENRPIARIVVAFILTILAVMSTVLAIQYLFTYSHVHYSNLSNESLFTLADTSLRTIEPNIILGFILIIMVVFFSFFSISKHKILDKLKINDKARMIANLSLAVASLTIIFKTTELKAFFAPRFGDNPIIKEYERLYYQEIEAGSKLQFEVDSETSSNIFIIQLESLTGRVVNQNVTPNLYKLSSEGVLVKNLQASSVNTARILETILCDIPPAINETLMKDPAYIERLECLPELLKEQGYKTIYLKHHDADDEEYKQFIRNIGFDEIHNSELFKEEDQVLTWGPEDNVAYQRFFEYLKREKDNKLFVYISLGAINHYPFKDHDKVDMEPTVDLSEVALNKKDQIITTNLQDIALGKAYTNYYEPMFSSNSHLFVYGDHTWPVGIHPYNKYNWANAYQENLVTSLLFLPAKNEQENFRKDVITENYYHSRDISKAILRLAGYEVNQNYLYDELAVGSQPKNKDRCLLSIQPYTDKKIGITMYPDKYIIDVYGNRVVKYDLKKDPDEKRPLKTDRHYVEQPKKIIQECFK